MPVINGRPLVIAAWTDGSLSESAWAYLVCQTSVIQIVSALVASLATT